MRMGQKIGIQILPKLYFDIQEKSKVSNCRCTQLKVYYIQGGFGYKGPFYIWDPRLAVWMMGYGAYGGFKLIYLEVSCS